MTLTDEETKRIAVSAYYTGELESWAAARSIRGSKRAGRAAARRALVRAGVELAAEWLSKNCKFAGAHALAKALESGEL